MKESKTTKKNYLEQLKAGKPKCYKKMNEMKVLSQVCKECIYKVDCMILTAKKFGELER